MGVVSAVVRTFNETAMHTQAQASNRLAKAIRASHGPRVSPQSQAKVRVRNTMENPKECSKEPKGANQGAKGLHKGKAPNTGLSGLENSKFGTCLYH